MIILFSFSLFQKLTKIKLDILFIHIIYIYYAPLISPETNQIYWFKQIARQTSIEIHIIHWISTTWHTPCKCKTMNEFRNLCKKISLTWRWWSMFYLWAIMDLLRNSVTKETLKAIAYCGRGVWCRGWRILERCIQKHHMNLSPSVFCCLHSHSSLRKNKIRNRVTREWVREDISNMYVCTYRFGKQNNGLGKHLFLLISKALHILIISPNTLGKHRQALSPCGTILRNNENLMAFWSR